MLETSSSSTFSSPIASLADWSIRSVVLSSFNPDLLGIDEFGLSDNTFPMTSWYGGRLNPSEETTTTYTIENPNNYPINVAIKPETLKLIEKLEMDGITEPLVQDQILNEEENIRNARLSLLLSIKQILNNSSKIIGIKMPNQM